MKVLTEKELEKWEEYERQMEYWREAKHQSEMHRAMSKPNKSGYFRANND